MTIVEDVAVHIENALKLAQDGLKQYPHDAIYRHAVEQIGHLQAFLNDTSSNPNTDMLAEFNLGQMAARELGVDEQDFASHLHSLQRFVDALFEGN